MPAAEGLPAPVVQEVKTVEQERRSWLASLSRWLHRWLHRGFIALLGWSLIGAPTPTRFTLDHGSFGAGVALLFFSLWPWRPPATSWKRSLYIGLLIFGVAWGFIADDLYPDAVFLPLFVIFGACWVTPDAVAPEHLRRRLRTLQSIGIQALAGLGMAGLIFAVLEGREVEDPRVGGLFFGILGWLFFLGRRHGALTAAELMERNKGRAPVLYLRSFQADDPNAKKKWYMRPLALKLREEEIIAPPLSAFGPVVAIGRPDEGMPWLGAARTYVPDDEWRDAVIKLMTQAELVVIMVGDSEGLQWEIQQATGVVEPSRLLFYFPQSLARKPLARSYEALVARLKSFTDWSFPDEIEDERLLSFDADGRGFLFGSLRRPTQLLASLNVVSFVLVPIQIMILRRRFANALRPLTERRRSKPPVTSRASPEQERD